jgi:HYR domain
MKKLYAIILLLLAFSEINAQDTPILWQQMFNNYTTIPTNGNPTPIAANCRIGRTISLANGDLMILGDVGYDALIERRSSNNSKIWEMRMIGNSFAFDALEADDGSIYIAGSTQYISVIRNKNFVTSTIVSDSLFTSRIRNSPPYDLICNNCTFRSVNGSISSQTDITTPVDWNKSFFNAFLMKLSSDGTVQWIRQFGGGEQDIGHSVVKADNGNVWVVGHTYSFEGSYDVVGSHQRPLGSNSSIPDVMAIKVSPSGQKLIAKFYGSYYGDESIYNYNQVVGSGDGGFAFVTISGANDGDFTGALPIEIDKNTVFKIASDGSIEWKKYMYTDYGYHPPAMRIVKTNDNGYVLLDLESSTPTNLTEGHHGQSDLRFTKLNSSGVIEWKKYFGGSGSEITPYQLANTDDNGFLIVSKTSSDDGDVWGLHLNAPPDVNNPSDFWLVKIDQNGKIQWNRAYGGTNYEGESQSVAQTLDGNFIFSGNTRSSDGDVIGNTQGASNQSSWFVKVQKPTCLAAQASNVTPNMTICNGMSVALAATCEVGTTPKWYLNDGITPLNSTTVTPSTTTFYRVQCDNNSTAPSCKSAYAQTKIWVNPTPGLPTVSNQTVCSNQYIYLTQYATCPTLNGNYTYQHWYEADGITPITNTVFNQPSNTNIYKVRCQQDVSSIPSCNSDFVDVTFTKKISPTVPVLDYPVKLVCLGSSYTLNATCSMGSTDKWYDLSNNPVTNLTITPTVSKNYQVRCETGGVPNCTSAFAYKDVYVTSSFNSPNAVTPTQNICVAGSNVSLSGQCYNVIPKWYDNLGNAITGTSTYSSSYFTTIATVNPMVTTTYTIKCEDPSNNVCTSSGSTIVNVFAPVSATVVTQNQTSCGPPPNGINLTATCPVNYNPIWYNNAETSLLPSLIVSPSVTTTYKVRCQNIFCTNGAFSSVTITINPIPIDPTGIPASQTICLGTGVSLQATCGLGSTPKWYLNLNDVIPITSTTVYPTSFTNYYVRCETGGTPNCRSGYGIQQINVQGITGSPISVTPSQTICNPTASLTLTGGCQNGNQYLKWYQNDETTLLTSTTVNPTSPTTYKVRCEQNNCPSPFTSVTIGHDVTLPTITAPVNVAATTNTACTAVSVVLGTPITADNCSVASVTNNAPTAFPLGVTTVIWTVTDGSGNIKTANQTVTVTDNILPTITAPANKTATTNTACTATGVVLGTPITADNCSIASVTNNAPTAFPLGVTTVVWTVTDGSGNIKIATQTVTVTDNVLPTITAPANAMATISSGCTVTGVVLGTPTTSDNCSVASTTNNAPTAFPIGVTTVIWTVIDGAGNIKTANQTVTVTDNVLPTITAPANVTATTNTACTATGVVLGTPTTADNCSVASTTNNAPTAFPLGVTTVIWTVTDGSGNTKTATQMVTITDNVLPTIIAPANVTTTTNTACTATGVILGTPTTADNCSVASVTNNAPTAFPLGVTTVVWTVTDAAGNIKTANQTITVTLSSGGSSIVISTQSGDWNSPSTWQCGDVPTATKTVEVQSGHIIEINNDVHAKSVKLLGTGKLNYTGTLGKLILNQ